MLFPAMKFRICRVDGAAAGVDGAVAFDQVDAAGAKL
jgi:hypothetical protein